MNILMKDTNQKILLNELISSWHLPAFGRFDPATDRTSAVGRGNFTALALAFVGNFIHYYPGSSINSSSCTDSLGACHHSHIDYLELATLHANFKWRSLGLPDCRHATESLTSHPYWAQIN